ncbi:MAG: hypothetical protein IJ225_05770 [Solobacterium sp.]|nr:hypothetical protein [Solobacterium sp.]
MTDDHERSKLLDRQTALSGLIENVYELMGEDKEGEAAEVWAEIAEDIWPVIDGVVTELNLDKKPTEDKIDRSYDKPYELNSVLADADVALAYSGQNEARLELNRRILDTFDTSSERYQYFSAKQAVAESLNGLGRYEECDSFLKEWKQENESEVYPDFVRLRCLYDRKQDNDEVKALADAYMAKKEIDAPHEDVMMLYEMIALIYGELGESELKHEAVERMNA